jgi:hypothetical protein
MKGNSQLSGGMNQESVESGEEVDSHSAYPAFYEAGHDKWKDVARK